MLVCSFSQLKRPKTFTDAIVIKDDSVLKAGKRSLSEFQAITRKEAQIVTLREAGLTDEEINMKLIHKSNTCTDEVSL